MTNPAKKPHYMAIEVGRGVAAIMVVLHHAGSIVTEQRFKGLAPFGYHLGNFNAGVDFFFVLSGFIIAWIHWADIGQTGRLRAFAEKRFIRIYPAYWGIVLPLILLYLLVPGGGSAEKRDPLNILLSFLLLPNPMEPVLGVAWTLTHEMLFYLLFAIIIRLGKPALALLPLWAVAIIVFHFVARPSFPLSFLFSPFNIEFILGVGAAAALRRFTIPRPRLLMTIGIAGFAALVLFAIRIQEDPLAGRLALGSCATLFVLGCVEAERHARFRVPGLLLSLGAASYSIYLIHPFILSVSIQLLKRAGLLPLFSPETAALFIAVVATIAGLLYSRTIEKWLTALARRMFRHNKRDIASPYQRAAQP